TPAPRRVGGESCCSARGEHREVGHVPDDPTRDGRATGRSLPNRGAGSGYRAAAREGAMAQGDDQGGRAAPQDEEGGMMESTTGRAIDMWAPIVPVPEVMRH